MHNTFSGDPILAQFQRTQFRQAVHDLNFSYQTSLPHESQILILLFSLSPKVLEGGPPPTFTFPPHLLALGSPLNKGYAQKFQSPHGKFFRNFTPAHSFWGRAL